MTITEFLLARITEDEEIARSAIMADTGQWFTWTGDDGIEQDFPSVAAVSEEFHPDEGMSGTRFVNVVERDAIPNYVQGEDGQYLADETGRLISVGPHDLDVQALDHIARHDPARVLAECKAKRTIVEMHHPEDVCNHEGCTPICGSCGSDTGSDDFPCRTVLAVAAIYADHPDYDPAWAV